MTILVTGAAGFIGFHVAQKLLARGDSVIGIDNLNSYYDVSLKEARLENLKSQDVNKQFCFKQIRARGFWLLVELTRLGRAATRTLYAELTQKLASGAACVDIAATYPLAEIESALRHAAQPAVGGKIILTMGA